MKKNYSKATWKKLRQLADIAHERELAGELHKLCDRFGQWQAGEIDPFALNEHIHQFHQQTSREIWTLYNLSHDHDFQVASALKFGFLAKEEVGGDLIEELGPLCGFFNEE